MSIIDSKKKDLNPELWENNKPKLELVSSILNPLFNIISKEDVSGIYFVGSNTTQHYRANSDIDVNVIVNDKNIKDIFKLILDITALNGKKFADTNHEINYYITSLEKQKLLPSSFDLLKNDWTSKQDYPNINVEESKDKVRHKLYNVNQLIFDLESDILDYEDLIFELDDSFKSDVQLKIIQIHNDMKTIESEYKRVLTDRKANFSEDSLANLLYKFLEKYNLLQKMKRVYTLLQDGFQKQDIQKYQESSVPISTISKFISESNDMFSVGDCKKAADYVESKYPEYKATKLNITNEDPMVNYVGVHYFATDMLTVIDLTAPAYIEAFIDAGIATKWHITHKNDMLFDYKDYIENFKKISISERLKVITLCWLATK